MSTVLWSQTKILILSLHLHISFPQTEGSLVQHLLHCRPHVVIKVVWWFKNKARDHISECNDTNNFPFLPSNHMDPMNGLGSKTMNHIAKSRLQLACNWLDDFSNFVGCCDGAHEVLNSELPERKRHTD